MLGGLARTIEAGLRPGKRVRVGWLTPLLGAFVMIDLLSFWQAAWQLRDMLRFDGPTMLGGLLFAGIYYLAAHLVFPRAPEAGDDLDKHYFRVRRPVLGTLLALGLLQIVLYLNIPKMAVQVAQPLVASYIALFWLLMIAAIVVRGRSLSAITLVALLIRYLVGLLT